MVSSFVIAYQRTHFVTTNPSRIKDFHGCHCWSWHRGTDDVFFPSRNLFQSGVLQLSYCDAPPKLLRRSLHKWGQLVKQLVYVHDAPRHSWTGGTLFIVIWSPWPLDPILPHTANEILKDMTAPLKVQSFCIQHLPQLASTKTKLAQEYSNMGRSPYNAATVLPSKFQLSSADSV